jgi:hypothetical protein
MKGVSKSIAERSTATGSRVNSLHRTELVACVLVTTGTNPAILKRSDAAIGTAQVMAGIGGTGTIEIVAIRKVAVVTLIAARDTPLGSSRAREQWTAPGQTTRRLYHRPSGGAGHRP